VIETYLPYAVLGLLVCSLVLLRLKRRKRKLKPIPRPNRVPFNERTFRR
jgi:hypothetical protein